MASVRRAVYTGAPSTSFDLARMKILLWNIRTGGSGRADALADAIAARDPDVIVLNGYRTSGSDRLLALLEERG